jgi:hypothetical protein
MKMPFGKHKGAPLDALPSDYFAWLLSLDLKEPLKSALAMERERRYCERAEAVSLDSVKGAAKEIVSVGYRTLAQRWHPDHGGDHKKMQAINAAKEYLEQRI